jgi:CheY-specific phosphatase CheX
MNAKRLSNQQRSRLEKSVQAGLDTAGRTLRMLLGGEIRLGIVSAGTEFPGVAVRLGLSGALAGGVSILLPETLALAIAETLLRNGQVSLLNEEARSAIMEFGNILASAFVVHFDQQQGLRTLPTTPALSLVRQEPLRFDGLFCADFYWSSCLERGQVLIGFEGSALDILLAG